VPTRKRTGRKTAPRKTAPKKATRRRTSRRGGPGRWYDSNWFLLLIAVLVIVGIRVYRSQRAGGPAPGQEEQPPPESTAAGAITPDEPPTPTRQLAEPASIRVITEAPGAIATAPIAAHGGPGVLRQAAQPGTLPPLDSSGTEAGDLVADVTGSVSYRGLLNDEVVVPTTDRHVCQEHEAGALRLSDDHLADVMVWIDASNAQVPSEEVVTVVGCRISPRAIGLRTAGTLTLASGDAVEHRIVATDAAGERSLLATLAPGGEPVRVIVDRPGLFRLSCEHHPWAEAFLMVADDAHISITDVDGRFHLSSIPIPESGQFPFRVFHSALGTYEQILEMGGPLHLDIDLTERAR